MVKGEIGNWSRIQREAGRYRANNRRRPRLTVGNNRQSPRRFQLISPLSSPASMYDRLRTQLVSASGFVSIKEPTANPFPFPSTHRYRDIIGLLARSLTGVTVIEPPHRCLSLPLTYFPSPRHYDPLSVSLVPSYARPVTDRRLSLNSRRKDRLIGAPITTNRKD